jgi:hypothetical protein
MAVCMVSPAMSLAAGVGVEGLGAAGSARRRHGPVGGRPPGPRAGGRGGISGSTSSHNTGCRWRDLPPQLGAGSGHTAGADCAPAARRVAQGRQRTRFGVDRVGFARLASTAAGAGH